MTSRRITVIAVAAVIAALVSALPPVIERLSPPAGLIRSVFPQLAFGGAPMDARTSEINLRFLDEEPGAAPPEFQRALARIFLRLSLADGRVFRRRQ